MRERGSTDRYRPDAEPPFDPIVFDVRALRERGLVTGTSGGGRAGATFFTLGGASLVLRPYRRGGAVRHLSPDRYVSLGLERSRAMREFALLLELERLELPAPRAYAARRTSHGVLESGALVTYRLPGRTLAERIAAGEHVPWADIGRCIARFHRAGVVHADLNAHNVLVADEAPGVFLIDFDRGRILGGGAGRAAEANVTRLRRSLVKVSMGTAHAPDVDGADALAAAWREKLSVG